MLKVDNLDDVRGNNVIIYSIKTLLEKGNFPRFTILSGHMGVGKSTVAGLVAKELNKSESPVITFNFGMSVDMKSLEESVFKMNPSVPRAFVFEELHGLDKAEQTALLTMLDSQPANVYILCTTTEIYKVLRTIRSRATVWDFKLLGERQLSQLLDDYLEGQATQLTQKAKNALLKSCYGVPRDLLKNADLAVSGDFTAEQLDALLGHVSEDLIYSLLCSLKSSSIDFSTNMATLMEESSRDKLVQLRDFFTRFLLERRGIEGATLDRNKIATLDSLFNSEELEKIGRTLVKATPDTLMLELSLLNMELTGVGRKQMVGQQINRVATNVAKAAALSTDSNVQARINDARLTPSSLKSLTLDS